MGGGVKEEEYFAISHHCDKTVELNSEEQWPSQPENITEIRTGQFYGLFFIVFIEI